MAPNWTPQSWQEKPARQMPDYPDKAALDRVLRKCLAKDPDEQWQPVRDLKDELEGIASGLARQCLVPLLYSRGWVS